MKQQHLLWLVLTPALMALAFVSGILVRDRVVRSVPSAPDTARGNTIVQGASRDNLLRIFKSGGFSPILEVSFTVPDGRSANVAVTFSGYVMPTRDEGSCYGAFRLDSPTAAPFGPGEWWISEPPGIQISTITASKNGVGPGPHTVYMTVDARGTDCDAESRSLNIVASLNAIRN